MQTRLQSLFEAWMNVFVGYVIAVGSQLVIFPWYGIHMHIRDNLFIGLWFTLVSITRSYGLRRFYNWKHQS